MWGYKVETLNNDQLIESVIAIAKDVFDENEQNYMPKTKVNKLTVLVAEELEKHQIQIHKFYWGYYRHGFYSESINSYIHSNYGESFHLKTASKHLKQIPSNIATLIKNAILKYKNYFIQDRTSFLNWIYTQKTPMEYRSFYKVHRIFLNLFRIIKDKSKNLVKFFNNNNNKIKNIISVYYGSLKHVKDPETMALFRKFTDLIEYTFIKIKNGYNPKKLNIFFKELEKTYDIFLNLLTPYLNTLKGDERLIPSVIKTYKNKRRGFISSLEKRIANYYQFFENHDLFPTFEEMEKELQELSEEFKPEDTDIDKIYQIIGVNTPCIQ